MRWQEARGIYQRLHLIHWDRCSDQGSRDEWLLR